MIANLLAQIPSVELVIPAWQVALLVIIISVFMFANSLKWCLVTTYLFTLYWGFFLSLGDVMSLSRSSPNVGTLYILSGILQAVLILIAFFKKE